MKTSLVMGLVAAAAAGASAEMFECGVPGSGSCDFTAADFSNYGYDIGSVSEILSNEVAFPGTGTVDLTFRYLEDTGAFNFCFGFCLMADITPSVLAAVSAPGATEEQRKAFALECLVDHGQIIFEDSNVDLPSDPSATKMFPNVPVPAGVIFFLLPDNTGAQFMANPDNFFLAAGQTTTVEPGPLFSLSTANPGEFDQLVLFTDGSRTLFGWEDKQRAAGSPEGASDEDFSDLIFDLDTVLTPDIPSGCTQTCTYHTNSAYNFANPAAYTGFSASYAGTENCACLQFE